MYDKGGNAVCSEELKLIAGENLKTVFSVHSRKEQNFSINRAYVELMQYGENIKQIDCEIDEHDIEFMLRIDEPGRYDLIVTYFIADETLKEMFKVEVR